MNSLLEASIHKKVSSLEAIIYLPLNMDYKGYSLLEAFNCKGNYPPEDSALLETFTPKENSLLEASIYKMCSLPEEITYKGYSLPEASIYKENSLPENLNHKANSIKPSFTKTVSY